MKYTRDQAICMAFYVDYNEENVKKYKKKIEDLETFDICWNIKENQPVLVSLNRIRSDPLGYKRYPESNPTSDQPPHSKRKKVELATKGQVKQFLNEVFSSKKRENSLLYSQKSLATRDIHTVIKMHTSLFNSCTAQSFATWCRNTKVDFLNAKEKREKNITRELSVLHDTYHDELVDSITNYLPRYQDSLKSLERAGMELVAYARKSPTDNNNNENNARLIQSMVGNLKERSFATRVYVSTSSWASTPFSERDLKTDSKVMESFENVNGTTQDLLEYINSCDHDICLISIGFAGLTTRSVDLLNLIENNPAIKKIAIETFTLNNEIFIFDAQDLQDNQKILDRFDYRNEFFSRSK